MTQLLIVTISPLTLRHQHRLSRATCSVSFPPNQPPGSPCLCGSSVSHPCGSGWNIQTSQSRSTRQQLTSLRYYSHTNTEELPPIWRGRRRWGGVGLHSAPRERLTDQFVLCRSTREVGYGVLIGVQTCHIESYRVLMVIVTKSLHKHRRTRHKLYTAVTEECRERR